MELTVKQAAALLGKSERTVRLLAQTGRIAARRAGKAWVIDGDALAEADGAEADHRRLQAEAVRETVERVLNAAKPPPADGGQRGFYSVRDLRIYADLLGAIREMAVVQRQSTPSESVFLPSARDAAAETLRQVAEACHQFSPSEKIAALLRARQAAARCVADLLLAAEVDGLAEAAALADRVEGDVLGSIRGLVRREERRREKRK